MTKTSIKLFKIICPQQETVNKKNDTIVIYSNNNKVGNLYFK